MHPPAGNQWMMILFAVAILGTVCYQEVSAGRGPVRVTRSAVESLRDRGTYIIHFKDHVTEEELQQFSATLSRNSDEDKNFIAEIIEEVFIIKCLITRLSGKALNWVSSYCFTLLSYQYIPLVISYVIQKFSFITLYTAKYFI